jgi:hypothetical protein
MVSPRHCWLNTSFLIGLWIDRSLHRCANKALRMSWHILYKFLVDEPLCSLRFHVILWIFRAHEMSCSLTRHHRVQSLELLRSLWIRVTKAQILLGYLLITRDTILNWISEHSIQSTSVVSSVLVYMVTSLWLSYSSSHSPRFLDCYSWWFISSWSVDRIQTNISLTNWSSKLRHIVYQALNGFLHDCIYSVFFVDIKVISSGSIWGAKLTLRMSKLTLTSFQNIRFIVSYNIWNLAASSSSIIAKSLCILLDLHRVSHAPLISSWFETIVTVHLGLRMAIHICR